MIDYEIRVFFNTLLHFYPAVLINVNPFFCLTKYFKVNIVLVSKQNLFAYVLCVWDLF